MRLLRPDVRVHFVGIGGIGLSAIARVLRGRGYAVSGSDRQATTLTRALAGEGIDVLIGHRAENLPLGEVLVVASSAVPSDNPELVAARDRGLAVVRREQMLADLTEGLFVIAVAGTHGKTTTSALIAWILSEAGLDPSFVVGGVLHNLGTNGRAGSGPVFVIEADEYDRAFLGLWPDVAVVTTLEHDHPDCYPTFAEMKATFAEFAGRASQRLIVCDETTETRALGEQVAAAEVGKAEPAEGRVLYYGTGAGADWRVGDVELGGSPTFRVWQGSKRWGTFALQLPGRHNVLNAVAALAAAAEAGVAPDAAMAAVARFQGTARRFELKGSAAGVTVVDDYAHHPTEIRATLAAARTKYTGRPVWAVFQPHTFSRTAVLLDDFAAAFADADHVLVSRIYAAREADAYGVSGADLVRRVIADRTSRDPAAPAPDVRYVASIEDAVACLLAEVQPDDVVLTLGAGDGDRIGELLLEKLGSREAASALAGAPAQRSPAGSAGGYRSWLS